MSMWRALAPQRKYLTHFEEVWEGFIVDVKFNWLLKGEEEFSWQAVLEGSVKAQRRDGGSMFSTHLRNILKVCSFLSVLEV